MLFRSVGMLISLNWTRYFQRSIPIFLLNMQLPIQKKLDCTYHRPISSHQIPIIFEPVLNRYDHSQLSLPFYLEFQLRDSFPDSIGIEELQYVNGINYDEATATFQTCVRAQNLHLHPPHESIE